MTKEYLHIPVLLDEVLEYLDPKPGHIVLDGTLGGGGHAAEMAKRIAPNGMLIGIDQDSQALEAASMHLEASNLGSLERVLLKGNFSELDTLLPEVPVAYLDRVLLDIGVSSHQIDEVERGFSFKQNAPLDMRMNQEQELDAATVVNTYSKAELTRIISIYGEERWASRIADFIVKARAEKPLQNSEELVELIKAAIPASARRSGGHPAKKTFQALRIEVNRELEVLEQGIESALRWLSPGGRLGIITFHSLEDRIVKRAFAKKASSGDRYRKDFPLEFQEESAFELITRKAISAREEEIERNARSRSAKLRVIAKKEV